MTQRERIIVEATARTILAGFRLSNVERKQEVEALAEVLEVAMECQLENLEHRRVTA